MKPKYKHTLIEEIRSSVALYVYDHNDENFEITLSIRVKDGWANVEETEGQQ